MKYLAAIALLAAVCVALSCRPRPEQAERAEGSMNENAVAGSSAEGATGTGRDTLARPGTATAPSEVRPMSWWLGTFLAVGIAAVLYLLDWLRGGEG